jgi:hypothetical protein
LVELRPITVRDVAGSNSGRVSANISNVPVPNRRYSADVAFIGFSHGTVKLLFAQEKFGSTELRTLLIVKMSVEAASRFLDSVAEAEKPFDEFAQEVGVTPEQLGRFESEPKDTVAFDANFVLVGLSGHEACADFYHSSAFAIGASQASGKLAMDPVVRVDLRASLLLGVLKELELLLRKVMGAEA